MSVHKEPMSMHVTRFVVDPLLRDGNVAVPMDIDCPGVSIVWVDA